uniref:Cilia- and flagella-associated protein 299 n=1 Tax=Paramormyrops kingsleyae TaxID=1676925 RepID=A0A3B3Q4Q7_9TELE|nr:uncharacterized protein C4orf22 homolog [Paramormyrops kingsleyae]
MEADASRGHPAETFRSYEDLLDNHVKPLDLFYLEDEELARQLVQLGYRGSRKVMTREDFERAKAVAEEESRLARSEQQQQPLASMGTDLEDNFLRALAEREEPNRSGKMTSIIFIRDHNFLGHEISGYIDYCHRLKTEDFRQYFKRTKKLLPRSTDLSFYNWNTHICTTNSSPNFEVWTEDLGGLLFVNKRDQKILNVDPQAKPGDSSLRTPLRSDLYLQVLIFDHITRRKI